MAEFKEGQEVEVWGELATIVKLAGAADLPDRGGLNWYLVRFPCGYCATYDEEHIRPVREPERFKSVEDDKFPMFPEDM